MSPMIVNMLDINLNLKIGEDISLSPLTKKQLKPRNNSVVSNLLVWNHSVSFGDFSIQHVRTKCLY